MKTDSLISIIIPVYNCENYLSECLESVIHQTHKNLEIILVNDGSSDSTGSICEQYASLDRRVRYIMKENGGLSSARRRGIDFASGEYFCTIDGDDILSESYVEKLYTAISKHNADIALCGRKSFDKNGEVIEYPLSNELPEVKVIDIQEIRNNYYGIAIQYQMSDSWNKMYKTEFVRKSKVKHELSRKYNGTDLLFNYLILLHLPKITTVKEILYYYRIVSGSIVHRKDKPLQEGFEAITKRLIDECEKLKFNKSVMRQVMLSYYGMLKYASLDIANEYRGRELAIRFKDLTKRHKNYVKEIGYDIGIRELGTVKSRNLQLFYCLLKIGNYRGVLFYYAVRSARENE